MSGWSAWAAGAWAESLGWALLHFLWQGAAVGLVFGAALVGLRKSTANARYVAAASALALLIVLPVTTFFLVLRTPAAPTASESYQRIEHAESSGEIDSALSRPAGLSARNPFRPLAEGSPEAAVARGAVAVGRRLEVWLPWIVLAWGAGVVLLSVRLFGAWVYLQRLRHTLVEPVALSFQIRLERLRLAMGVRRPVQFLESLRLLVPCTVGWLRPVVLLPASALTGLSPAQLEAIVAHEFAHIRRHDFFVNLLQSAVETVLFYHPVVWWVSRTLREERENCCDDAAVAACGDRTHYARSLAELESARSTLPSTALAATGGPFLLRIRRILLAGEAATVRPQGWMAAMALFLVAAFAIHLHSRAQQGSVSSEQTGVLSVANPASPDLSKSTEASLGSGVLPDADDVADIPAHEHFAGGNERMRYALIGPHPGAAAPNEGYRLLVVLPGGDGGADFHPFVKRIFKLALNDRYLVAQLIAPRWSEDQFTQVVWPTRTHPWPSMAFPTEDFIEEVVVDVAREYPVDPDHVFALGWSSGGPPVYAESLAATRNITGSFVAMSVFKPNLLPPLDRAAGHAYFLLYSPEDFIPRSMPENARDALQRAGAQVKTLTYPGGHGWRADVYGNISAGIRWLESTRNPFTE